jgi:hypothetical protein
MDKVRQSELTLAIASIRSAQSSLKNADDHLMRAMREPDQLSNLDIRLLAETRAILRACETLLRAEPDFVMDLLHES